jgi:hypothetical protein
MLAAYVITLASIVIFAVQAYPVWRAPTTNFLGKFAICLMATGFLGFIEPFWINLFPAELLNRVELPNALGGVRLTAPDGHVFIVSSPIARVQRYGPDGFENGFMYGRKAFKFGISSSGDVLICAAGTLLTYRPDGAEVLPQGSCGDEFAISSSSYPSHAKLPKIAFNWFSALAVPLWHPILAWVICLFSALLFKVEASVARCLRTPPSGA